MKSRTLLLLFACVALLNVALSSCTDDTLIEVSEKHEGQLFELTVSGSQPESRLELGQDGLSTQWEPGDKLVLVDKKRVLAPIFLNCTLTEKADQATFVSESGVPSGDYYVIYNYNENLVYGHKGFQSIEKINSNDDLVLWNELTVEEGTSSAAISLKHLYAKVRVVLKNVPSNFYNGYIGMYSSCKGFPIYKLLTGNGMVDAEYGYNPNSMNNSYGSYSYFASNRKFHNIPFGYYNPEYHYSEEGMHDYDFSKAEEMSVLVLPADLSEEDLFFYVICDNTCYEIKKTGANIKAGTSYKVELDFSQATVSKLNSRYDNDTYSTVYQLATPADCRHAAYRHGMNINSGSNDNFYMEHATYEITKDIDFTDEYFFPIATRKIIGGNHTLSNISLEWHEQDNVGLVRYDWYGRNEKRELMNSSIMQYSTTISDLTLENVTFKGYNYVGALGGYNVTATNCAVIGNSHIEGYGNYVGGLVGANSLDNGTAGSSGTLRMEDVRIGQQSSVIGKNNVGGVVGAYVTNSYYTSFNAYSSIILLESCQSEATVTATEDYVGGIFGKLGGSIYSSNTSSSVEFTMEDYTFSLMKCVNEGDVSGRYYVGGIGGQFALNSYNYGSNVDRVVLTQSCSTGDVSGDTYVGGVLGNSYASINICYSTGNVSASNTKVGGIVGTMDGMMGAGARVANCYSLASISATTGGAGGILGVGACLNISNCYYAARPDCSLCRGIVGYSERLVNVINCLTTLDSIGELNFNRIEYTWDSNYDGVTGPGDDYYDCSDSVTNSLTEVDSILDNIAVINGDNAYATNIWPLETYPWYCVKFASFSAETDSPDYDNDTI